MSGPFDVVVRGGTVVGPEGRSPLDVCVRDGRVAALCEPAEQARARELVDASGLLVLPGMIDTHVHFMDPGELAREDFLTGTAAAARAGVTTVVEHTHAWPVTTVERWREKTAHLDGRAYVDYGLAAHVWPEHIDELEGLWQAGITYFKAFTCATHGVPPIDTATFLALAELLARLDAPCLAHCEDNAITARNEEQLRAAGHEDGSIVPRWRSREAELVSVASVAVIARLRQARVIVAHVSNADALDLLAAERALGSPILAECCPQYLHLREAEVHEHGAFRKFTPPARIRSDEDERRMWDAFNGGSIHHISSDHAPSTAAHKRAGGVWEVPFGLPGIDTTMALMLHAALSGQTSLERLVEAYATAPARLYGLAGKGRLAPGLDADLVLVDPAGSWEVSDADIVSKAGWSPYTGRRLRGRVVATMLRGALIARDGALLDESRRGRLLRGPGAGVNSATAAS